MGTKLTWRMYLCIIASLFLIYLFYSVKPASWKTYLNRESVVGFPSQKTLETDLTLSSNTSMMVHLTQRNKTSLASTHGLSSVPRILQTITEPPKCTSKTNIVFVKTHKTASTAVQNILLRYGLHNHLRFALPRNAHDFNYPGMFSPVTIANHGSAPYNIMCHHMRFNYVRVKSSMPSDSLYISILREPGQVFESTFDYLWPIVPAFQRVPHKGKNSMEKWLDNAAQYVRAAGRSTYSNFGKSPTFFDLGFDNMNDRDSYISNSIAKLDKIFDLVLISDYFEESMVLFADLLCWKLEDVACLSLNARTRNEDAESERRHARIREKTRKWNKADAVLFDHFNATLWRKIDEYGRDRMKIDVERLRIINTNLTATCIEGGGAVDSSKITDLDFKKTIFKPKDVAVQSYNLKNGAENLEECRHLIAAENDFSREIFNIQQIESVKERDVPGLKNRKLPKT